MNSGGDNPTTAMGARAANVSNALGRGNGSAFIGNTLESQRGILRLVGSIHHAGQLRSNVLVSKTFYGIVYNSPLMK